MVTLSLVMTSWEGTSWVTVLRSTRTMRSMNGQMSLRPGVLRFDGSTRPSRNSTPRSYSLTTRTDFTMTMRAKNAANPNENKNESMGPILSGFLEKTSWGRSPKTLARTPDAESHRTAEHFDHHHRLAR